MNDEELKQQKEIEFYASVLQAWQNTKMELDKNILTLSSGAIGLLVTFINTFGVKTQCQIVLYIISIGAFLVAIISSLIIFNNNAKYLEKIIRDPSYTSDSILGFLDKMLIVTFIIGIIGTIMLSIISISNQKKGNQMPEKTNTQQTNTQIGNESLNNMNDLRSLNESFNNFANLQPKNTQEKSLNNMGNLKPNTSNTQVNTQDKNSSGK